MSEGVIRTEGLTRDYGDVRAVDGVTLAIPAGRVVALLGPNGAGKSTLLRLVAGMIEPAAGRAEVLGAPAREMPADVTARLGLMLEGHEPPRWATPRRLIALQAETSPRFDREAAVRLCDEHGLSLEADYGRLSKGQKRWVLASLVLASGADAMLLDEPADGLDPSARRALYDRLRDVVSERDATAIVATHIIHDIERVADDVALIRRGRLVLYESLEDLREQVREIELPEDAEPPRFGEGVEVLGQSQAPGAKLIYVKSSAGEEAIRAQLVGATPIRPVGLESLYLALMENRHSQHPDPVEMEAVR